MTPQETALVRTLLERLKTTGGQPKDPEAELLIRPITTEQADAAYYLVQTVLIQDLSLHTAQHRIAELERNLAQAKTALAPPPSFLGGLLGANQPANPTLPAAPSPPPEAAAPPAGSGVQAGNQVLPLSAAGSFGEMGTGDFLRAAATTAARVAGGALIFEGLQSMFGHDDAAGIIGNQARSYGLGETVMSNEPLDADTAAGRSLQASSSPADRDYASDHDFGRRRADLT